MSRSSFSVIRKDGKVTPLWGHMIGGVVLVLAIVGFIHFAHFMLLAAEAYFDDGMRGWWFASQILFGVALGIMWWQEDREVNGNPLDLTEDMQVEDSAS